MLARMVKEAALDFLAQASGLPTSALTMETKLGAEGLGLDSITCLELMLSVEAVTGLQLRSETLTGDAFDTIGGFIRYASTAGDG